MTTDKHPGKQNNKILIVDDEEKIRNILKHILVDKDYLARTASSGENAIAIVDEFSPDLILMDQNMPGMNGIDAMVKIKDKHPDQTVIIFTAYGSIPLAVEAIKQGAYDYISKPFDNEELMILINRALEHNRLTIELFKLKNQLQEKYSFNNIIGISPKIDQVLDQVSRVCEIDTTVLVQGESGTGKEIIVKAIHYHSQRKEKPLIMINCGAVPVNLLESEFFGHEKGAFTDAKGKKIGKFEQAHTGTLFLDEIGELPLESQVKLLRVLEDGKINRIGSNETISIDVRIIAATNKNLQKEVENGSFRLDLYYRLNIFTITIPPLRERKEDIPLLVEYFINKYNKKFNRSIKNVSKSTLSILQDYFWPGNVRDLENAIESAMILAKDDVIKVDDLPLSIHGYTEDSEEMDLNEVGLEDHISSINKKIEKELIYKALEKCHNNRETTAKLLKISRKTLFNKMKKYDLIR